MYYCLKTLQWGAGCFCIRGLDSVRLELFFVSIGHNLYKFHNKHFTFPDESPPIPRIKNPDRNRMHAKPSAQYHPFPIFFEHPPSYLGNRRKDGDMTPPSRGSFMTPPCTCPATVRSAPIRHIAGNNPGYGR